MLLFCYMGHNPRFLSFCKSINYLQIKYLHFPDRTQSSSSEESGELNDSIWAVIGGFAKGYDLTFDYVLYNISYTNMIMYGAILPTYDKKKNDGKKDEEQKVIKADDPRNKEEVRKFFETCD